MRPRLIVLVAGGSAILGVEDCRDSTTQAAPAPTLSVTAVSDLNQQGTVNQFVRSNPTVRVTDAAGHPVADVSVVFTAVASNGSASATTGPDGIAFFRWKLATVAGTQEVTATLSSDRSTLDGLRFTAIALPDSLAAISAVSATAQVGVELENPPALPVILATDQFHNPKPGVAVTFEVAGAGGVASATTTTDTTGRATADWKLGATVGTDTLVARAQTVGPVYFAARVVPAFTATSVVSGATHSCALTPGGDVYCWGDNRAGQANPASLSVDLPLPTHLLLPVKLVSLSALNGHTCGISNESPPQAFCWGLNKKGQLGQPGTSVATAIVKVPVAEGLAAVTTGAEHTCGLTPAGVAYCWGDNTFGQLGTVDTLSCSHLGLATTCLGPRRVASDTRFIALTAGNWHTCGLTPVGQLYCWGLDDVGQLGFDAAKACLEYVPQFDENDPVACALTPQLVPGSSSFTSVVGGLSETCGLSASGSVSCLGLQGSVTVSTGPFMRLSLDGACGIAADGSAYCWTGTFDAPRAGMSTPMRIGVGRTFATLSAGLGTLPGPPIDVYTPPGSLPHRCGVLASNSAVVCWGTNDFGQLGNGTTVSSGVPQPVILP